MAQYNVPTSVSSFVRLSKYRYAVNNKSRYWQLSNNRQRDIV